MHMAEDKKSFIAYCDWLETFEVLPDEKAGQLIKHILLYVNDKDPETDDILINAVFANIKHTLKRDLQKYNQYIDKQRLNGAKGGRPKKTQLEPKKPNPLSENPTEPKKADSVSGSVNVSVNVSDSVNDIKSSSIIIESAVQLKALLDQISDQQLQQMNELTIFSGNFEELKKKFCVEFIGRYGLNKTFKQALESLQSWMHKDKGFVKEKSFGKKEKYRNDNVGTYSDEIN